MREDQWEQHLPGMMLYRKQLAVVKSGAVETDSRQASGLQTDRWEAHEAQWEDQMAVRHCQCCGAAAREPSAGREGQKCLQVP